MSDFGKNLKKLRGKMSQEKLAEAINREFGTNLNKSMISKYENGKTATSETASVIAAYFGVSLNELLGIDVAENNDLHFPKDQIPVLGTIAAGTPMFAEQNIIGYAPEPPMINISGKTVFYLKVKGDSMDREFPDQSFVLVERDAEVNNGDIAAVLVNGDEATVKKVKCEKNLLTLIPMSHNEEHLPKTFDLEKEEVVIIGKVIGAFKQY